MLAQSKYFMFSDEEVWVACDVEDLWIFDKLILAKKLGYVAGPTGVNVPRPGKYIVRPITNLMGMGQGAEVVTLEKNTDFLPIGYFWCEMFSGQHLSVDYNHGKQVLCVEGVRDSDAPLYKWKQWQRVEIKVPYPSVLGKVFPFVNCEFIDGKLIEVHLRFNPDWKYGADIIFPVWEGEDETPPEGMKFVPDPDYKRKGFFCNK